MPAAAVTVGAVASPDARAGSAGGLSRWVTVASAATIGFAEAAPASKLLVARPVALQHAARLFWRFRRPQRGAGAAKIPKT